MSKILTLTLTNPSPFVSKKAIPLQVSPEESQGQGYSLISVVVSDNGLTFIRPQTASVAGAAPAMSAMDLAVCISAAQAGKLNRNNPRMSNEINFFIS